VKVWSKRADNLSIYTCATIKKTSHSNPKTKDQTDKQTNTSMIFRILEDCAVESIEWASRREPQFGIAKTEAALFTRRQRLLENGRALREPPGASGSTGVRFWILR
jgi:hypothetical protein